MRAVARTELVGVGGGEVFVVDLMAVMAHFECKPSIATVGMRRRMGFLRGIAST